MFIIGACTCIVVSFFLSTLVTLSVKYSPTQAAIVLSASVTFLSLPNLDNIARVAGLVATLFASFSMAATLVAIFKYKSEMVRIAPQIGEGIMWVSVSQPIYKVNERR